MNTPINRLRRVKRELRRERVDLSLPKKVRQVVELQKIAMKYRDG
ncbi:MAG: hypothetical protein ACRD2J_06485 [Thermoanaerobaculia bacterium]